MTYAFHKLFTVATLGTAFDATIAHQATHGRVAHVLVTACAAEFTSPATDKVKAWSLTVPETKAGFAKFSERFMACASNAGKARVYLGVSRAQGFALCEAFTAVREGLGLPTVEIGAAWLPVAKKVKPAAPAADAPAAPAADAPAAPAADAPAAPAADAPAAPAAAPLSPECLAIVAAIRADTFTSYELDAIMGALCEVADITVTEPVTA